MDTQFWLERWERNEIGFHQEDVHPGLRKFWPRLTELTGLTTVFVPLCGKSVDMRWLLEQGQGVLGVELSEIAARDFFHEQGLPVAVEPNVAFELYQGECIRVLRGDFFDLTKADLAGVGAIYDRAALIAMPEFLQARYVRHLLDRLPQRPPILLITLEYDQRQMAGPPFSTSTDRVTELYGRDYFIDCLSTRDILGDYPNFRNRGLTGLLEKAYLLRRLR